MPKVYYNFDLPDPIPSNAVEIITIARDIHQQWVDYLKRNCRRKRWNKYWVEAYDAVLEQLRKEDE